MKKLRKLGAIMICLAVLMGVVPAIPARAEETSVGIPAQDDVERDLID